MNFLLKRIVSSNYLERTLKSGLCKCALKPFSGGHEPRHATKLPRACSLHRICSGLPPSAAGGGRAGREDAAGFAASIAPKADGADQKEIPGGRLATLPASTT